MTRPVRIQRKRTKGWRMPENTRYVGRGTKWGNPFRVGEEHIRPRVTPGGGHLSVFVYDAAAAVRFYRRFLPLALRLEALELRGLNLACWCRLCDAHRDGKPVGVRCPDCAPCHVDVLLEIANAE